MEETWKKLWKSMVQYKVKILCWRMIKDWLPTRMWLHRRGILQDPHDIVCVFCFQGGRKHRPSDVALFTNKKVWRSVWSWIGVESPEKDCSTEYFLKFVDYYETICVLVVWYWFSTSCANL